tara:strand:+ start:275 stop:460 length:186 start_codon:yes stop_codon:yes gene_type:complete
MLSTVSLLLSDKEIVFVSDCIMAPALFVTLAPSLSVRLIALDVPALIVPEFVIVKFAESIP